MRNPYQLESKSGLKLCYAQAFNEAALVVRTDLYIWPDFGNHTFVRENSRFCLISVAIEDVPSIVDSVIVGLLRRFAAFGGIATCVECIYFVIDNPPH